MTQEQRTQLTLYIPRERKEAFKKAVRSQGWRTITSYILAMAGSPRLITSRAEWFRANGLEVPKPKPRPKKNPPGKPENLRPKQLEDKKDAKNLTLPKPEDYPDNVISCTTTGKR